MTNHWTDIKNADLVLIMGGNAAEAHPCGFKWVTEAKAHNKARLLVVDPRFTRSASVADYYAPIRTGTDIAFLGGTARNGPEDSYEGAIQPSWPTCLATASSSRDAQGCGSRASAWLASPSSRRQSRAERRRLRSM